MSSGINAPCSIAGGSTGYLQPIAPCKASPSWSTTIRLSTGLRATLLSIGWNTSPVRWWIMIPVAVYLSGSIALWWRGHSLWSRTEWKTKATISSLVLLGLLAFTVWLPGGLTQGLKLVGQSTSTVLAVVTAV